MATPLDKINEIIETLNTVKDVDGVPELLAQMMAIANNVDPDQLRKDLAAAVQIAYVPGGTLLSAPVPTGGLGTKVDGGRDTATDIEIVVPEKLNRDGSVKKAAQTVGDLIQESIQPQVAMAKLFDKYIRLVIREMVKESSLTEGSGGGAPPATGTGA